jgi:hypothetical protein
MAIVRGVRRIQQMRTTQTTCDNQTRQERDILNGTASIAFPLRMAQSAGSVYPHPVEWAAQAPIEWLIVAINHSLTIITTTEG